MMKVKTAIKAGRGSLYNECMDMCNQNDFLMPLSPGETCGGVCKKYIGT